MINKQRLVVLEEDPPNHLYKEKHIKLFNKAANEPLQSQHEVETGITASKAHIRS